MNLESRVHRKPATGRAVSVVIRRAELKGSSVFFTQIFLVSFQGFRNARYRPSGESWAPEISGLPNNSSRSISGGRLCIGVPKLADFGVSSECHVRFLDGLADLGAGERVQLATPAFLQARAGSLQFLSAKARMAHEFGDTLRQMADQTRQFGR